MTNQPDETYTMNNDYEQLEADLYADLMPAPPPKIDLALAGMRQALKVLQTPGVTREGWATWEDSLVHWCKDYTRLTAKWQKDREPE